VNEPSDETDAALLSMILDIGMLSEPDGTGVVKIELHPDTPWFFKLPGKPV
jgi:hypothetical protein